MSEQKKIDLAWLKQAAEGHDTIISCGMAERLAKRIAELERLVAEYIDPRLISDNDAQIVVEIEEKLGYNKPYSEGEDDE